ncbi:MAG: 23S rRNA (guanosine(2251)-2'-O)-methyltransferase RlmB [Acholeplasmatales bacterium]|nr:23S rRNA (guanosine(2251)-2'-O)-methyltransferase RlmB [Acholeplasmatales bacterium]
MIKIYGKNCIYEALRASAPLKKVFILDSQAKKDKNIVDILTKRNYHYQLLSKDKMDKEFGTSNQGYGAYREDYTIYGDEFFDMIPEKGGRVLLLDGIQDPHNLGAILRSVDAFSYDMVVLPKNRSAFITETVAHVSTGAIEYVKIAYVNSLLTAVTRLHDKNYWILGTDASGKTKTEDIDKSLNLAVIIGSEGFGMSKTLVKQSDFLITIPMTGHVNSLNASVSAGIVLKDLKKEIE